MEYFSENNLRSLRDHMHTSDSGFKFGTMAPFFDERAYQNLCLNYPESKYFRFIRNYYKRVFEGPAYDVLKDEGKLSQLSYLDQSWLRLIAEVSSEKFISILSQSLGIQFNTLRHFSFKMGKWGCEITPHIDSAAHSQESDSPSKLVMGLYFHQTDIKSGGTCLFGTDQKSILAQPKTLKNSVLFFQQHPKAYHGYKKLKMHERRQAVLMTFSQSKNAVCIPVSALTFDRRAVFKRQPIVVTLKMYWRDFRQTATDVLKKVFHLTNK